MWSVWHGSKLEKRLFGNKAEKQPLLGDHAGKACSDQLSCKCTLVKLATKLVPCNTLCLLLLRQDKRSCSVVAFQAFGNLCQTPLSYSIKCLAGNAEATQQYADLMWRPVSPQGYQPPTLHLPAAASRLDSHNHNLSRRFLEQTQRTHSQPLCNTEPHSNDSTRPGTPPTFGSHHVQSAGDVADAAYGYQPLLEPLLPVSDLLQSSSSQQPAQDHQAFRGASAAHPPFQRAQSFPIVPSVPALASPLQRPPSHHSHSPQPSEASQPALQGLHVPLEPHERQLLNNLLHRSNSTRSQDRCSDHSQSQSSTSTHLDSQPLSLPRSWSARRLTSGSLMLHDTSALQDPHDLSRYQLFLHFSAGQLATIHTFPQMRHWLATLGLQRHSPGCIAVAFVHSACRDCHTWMKAAAGS